MTELGDSLDDAERDRAARFRFKRDRQRFVIAHGLLRQLLSAALGCFKVSLQRGIKGKPALAGKFGLHFNMSHSEDWAVFALASERAVGIDLESAESLTRNGCELSALAARVLTPREFGFWHAIETDPVRTATFLHAWARKEACVKAAGLSVGEMQAIDVSDAATVAGTKRYTLHDLAAPAGFACALALRESGVEAFVSNAGYVRGRE